MVNTVSYTNDLAEVSQSEKSPRSKMAEAIAKRLLLSSKRMRSKSKAGDVPRDFGEEGI